MGGDVWREHEWGKLWLDDDNQYAELNNSQKLNVMDMQENSLLSEFSQSFMSEWPCWGGFTPSLGTSVLIYWHQSDWAKFVGHSETGRDKTRATLWSTPISTFYAEIKVPWRTSRNQLSSVTAMVLNSML